MNKAYLKRILILIFLFCVALNSVVASSILNPISSINHEFIKTSEINDEKILENMPGMNSDVNNSIKMLIITPNNPEFIEALTPLMKWKNDKGVRTIILSNFTGYEGVDAAEKIRNAITEYYNQEQIKWVLLAGDAQSDLLPTRYIYNPDVVEYGGYETVGNSEYKPSDFYFADLTGTWDEDGDGLWGESAEKNENGIDEIEWYPEVYVGRFPASNAVDLKLLVEKSLSYEKNPNTGEWMGRMLLAGGISDTISQEPPNGEDESRLTDYIIQNYVSGNMDYTHLWRSASYSPSDPKFPLTQSSFINEMNSGYSTVIFAGHGAYNQYSDRTGTVYTNNDAASASNEYMPSFIYADACSTSPFDLDSHDNSIGEILMKKKNSGAIGYIGGSRVTWYLTEDEFLEKLNRGNAKLFWKEFFVSEKYQPGLALYDSKVAYINSEYFTSKSSIELEYQRKQLLTYNLLGDPELDIYTSKPKPIINPLPSRIYSGQNLSLRVLDNNGDPVSNVRVHIRSNDGVYITKYANEQGIIYIKLPLGVNNEMNITITGHNLIPYSSSFSTESDPTNPTILSTVYTPKSPTSRDNLLFQVQAYDQESGIESVFLLLNTASGFHFYKLNKNETTNIFESRLNKLPPGSYEYSILVRDNSGNISILSEGDFKLNILMPFVDVLLIIFVLGIIFIMTFYLTKGLRLLKEFKAYRNSS